MKLNELAIIGVAATTVVSCTPAKTEYASYELYPVRSGSLTEMEYTPAATQFTLWAPTADEVRLMLFEAGDGGHAYETISMEPSEEGTWKTKVEKDLMGKFYTFNVKINDKWLGDTPGINAKAVGVNGKRAAIIDMKSTDPEGWVDDKRPALASPADVILYEMHHRDMSIDPSSGIEHKGKFLALTEQGTVSPDKLATGIDHLKELGVTHVHLLPSYDYASVDETKLDENKYNWGYDPQNYNVPDGSYSTDPYKPDVRIREFKQMVQALHKAGIRVVLDVVYNHTFSIDSVFQKTVPYYFYRQEADGSFSDGSACGNDTASERRMYRRYMIDCICYWVKEYHVDGFILNPYNVPMDIILKDPILSGVRILRHAEEFQNVMRRFLKGDEGVVTDVMYQTRKRWDLEGIYNCITTHTGFTLKDLVSYDGKHNEANGENNQDGPDYNYSWNCGAEGLTRKKAVLELRKNQMRNALFLLLLSQGVPCILAGDEFANSQKGNNNVYCQDNPIGWLNWRNLLKEQEMYQFVKQLIKFRKKYRLFHQEKELLGIDQSGCGMPDVSYHGEMAWRASTEVASRQIGIYYSSQDKEEADCFVAYNMHWLEHEFALPALKKGRKWYRAASTKEGILKDLVVLENQRNIELDEREIVVLVSGKGETV